jgi:GNAT superfamily N-acetyltransferase
MPYLTAHFTRKGPATSMLVKKCFSLYIRPMLIRSAQLKEYGEIAAVWYASASQMDGGAPPLDDPDSLVDRIVSSLAKGWNLKVAIVDGRIAGLLATIPDAHVLDQLFVAPEAQRKGIGTTLLNEAKCQLPNGFTLHTPVTNMTGQRFYEGHGLRAVRDAAHPVTGAPIRYFEWRQQDA